MQRNFRHAQSPIDLALAFVARSNENETNNLTGASQPQSRNQLLAHELADKIPLFNVCKVQVQKPCASLHPKGSFKSRNQNPHH